MRTRFYHAQKENKMLHSIIVIIIMTVFLCWIRSQCERNQLSVEETTIYSTKIKEKKTLVFLSDLHDKEFGVQNERLVKEIEKVKPDLIVIGGDTMVMKQGKESLIVTQQLLSKLVLIAPVYYGNGNHEQRLKGQLKKEFLQLIQAYQIHYLSDSSCEVGSDLLISGLNIEDNYYTQFKADDMDISYLTKHLGESSSERFHLLLAHSPLFFDTYVQWGSDLTLSGHFHGGTIRLPWLGGVMTPQIHFFCPYCAGEFEKNGKRLMVSRGLGTHSINIRLGNKPQIMVIHLQQE